MSRLAIRVILTVLISVGIIAGVYMSVSAAASDSVRTSQGMYVLGGGLVNPLQVQSASEAQEAVQPEMIKPYQKNEGNGHGCDSEKYIDPNDL